MTRKAATSSPTIAVVIPCYRETGHILDVLASIGSEVARIFVVDDACPDHTGNHVSAHCSDNRVSVITLTENSGVGGATIAGYRAAIEADTDIIVKLDGDGQMDPAFIPKLIRPIVQGRADYAKGNRFYDLDNLSGMPKVRIVGNLGLSFASKMSSGYWDLFDPTNGYTAIHAKVAAKLPLDKIRRDFFFESDMLFRLGTIRAVVADVPMAAHYGSETSSLSTRRVLLPFAWNHYVNTGKRLFYSYFLRDFSAASVELLVGKLMFLFGLIFGLWHWRLSVVTGIPATAGTVLLAALPILLGSQLLIAFLNFDTRNQPHEPLHPYL
ncbi:glycosyltransferase family 2 protein [Magnetospira sp. QH-2]|uniref:glycosyltransferase family 2 protein n=1 Tax=Magnetospira sp. (strain QH-2) TaxID=1288970 RepID=UPI00208EAEF6|nr:glycosyltransferase family 2 protein [Magnetospira sp. QH-2]